MARSHDEELERLTGIAEEEADSLRIPSGAALGRVCNVLPGQPDAAQTPSLPIDLEWTVTIQAASLPNNAKSTTQAAGYLAAYVTFSVGGTFFTKVIAPLGKRVRRLSGITARQVTVQIQWIGPGATSNPSSPSAATTPCSVRVGFARGGQSKLPMEFFGAQWINTQAGGVAGALYGAVTPQVLSGAAASGLMTACRLNVSTMPTGAGATMMWIHLFDASTTGATPTTGAVPLWESKPLLAAGDWDAFSDEFDPENEWTSGLWIGASSTSGTWTACGATPSFRFDLKAGA